MRPNSSDALFVVNNSLCCGCAARAPRSRSAEPPWSAAGFGTAPAPLAALKTQQTIEML